MTGARELGVRVGRVALWLVVGVLLVRGAVGSLDPREEAAAVRVPARAAAAWPDDAASRGSCRAGGDSRALRGAGCAPRPGHGGGAGRIATATPRSLRRSPWWRRVRRCVRPAPRSARRTRRSCGGSATRHDARAGPATARAGRRSATRPCWPRRAAVERARARPGRRRRAWRGGCGRWWRERSWWALDLAAGRAAARRGALGLVCGGVHELDQRGVHDTRNLPTRRAPSPGGWLASRRS